MDQAGAKTPTFLWRGILILLPVVLLAAVGLYSLRQDRQMAQVEAEARCQEVANDGATNLSDGLFQRMKNLVESAGLQIDDARRAVLLRGSPEMAASHNLPDLNPLSETNLSKAQIEAWEKARQIEFSNGPVADEILAWRRFVELSPGRGFLARAMYNLGTALWKDHDPEASQWFRRVQMEHSATTESGTPLWILAEDKLATAGYTKLIDPYQVIITHPSFLTPNVLSDLVEHDHDKYDAKLREDRWRDDEDTRDFYGHIRPILIQNPKLQNFWTWWNGESWLVILTSANKTNRWVDRFGAKVVAQAVGETLSLKSANPDYAKLNIEIAGKDVQGYEGGSPVLARADIPLFNGGTNCLTVSETLTHPEVLYAQQHRRTLWFAAIILASAAAASAGFVSAYRGFHQQLRLSEMKSNFVSSVSHELRAPIASMRLLAESLERGKITETVKQKEYYRFLVQESQRLSSLIENILDFSRIEQGRKQYHFESTNLPSLVEQTVKIMQPCAMERGVELIIEKGQWGDFLPVQCDGLSIQQALINLIDNAIKHSPNGAIVRVGMARRAAETSIFVEDNGPGIPADEHQRIFERFYRRGSELRRETQGIGIGLSIVKHTMDAHGGRIEVRSEVGQGSRFTIVLPDAKEQ
jgi:signal transduction histidine kinase